MFTRCGATEGKNADLDFEALIFVLCFFCGIKSKIAPTHGSLAVRAAPAERVRDCLESTESVKIHSRLCGTNPLPAETSTPLSRLRRQLPS